MATHDRQLVTGDPTGWTLADFAAAYRSGQRADEVIADVLALLDRAPLGVLIGPPLAASAMADAMALRDIDPASLPLYGVPFLAKDNIDIADVPTTAGCPGFAFTPYRDATVVAKLRAAGAIPVGKANLDQFATGLVGTRSPYGVPPNTLHPKLVPGGSSSGSAVGVALGLVPISLGTDTAGSGRVPAALNGVVGLKPTLASVSTFGIVPAVRRIDCPSIFARSVADASEVAAVVQGFDPLDPFSRAVTTSRRFRTNIVVGFPQPWPSTVTLDDDMQRWFDGAIERLANLGVEMRPVDISPLIEIGSMLYSSPIVAERTAAVGDAIAKGVDGLDPIVSEIISRGAEMSAVELCRAEYELARLRAEARPMWDEIDVLVLPTTPSTVTLDAVEADPFGANETMGQLTTFVNLLDLVAAVVPMEHNGAVVPAGLQFIAPGGHDDEVYALAASFETGTVRRPSQACTIVVVGAHLKGLALNHQLVDRRATLVRQDQTSADYQLFALPNTQPPKPGLIRVARGGAAIGVEVWSLGLEEFGSFVQQVQSPLCIGSIELADGSVHRGFLCEPGALEGAANITEFGGWRNYLSREP